MDLQLKDKVVAVTGGASGIGAAIVTAAAREGAIAVIIDRGRDLAQNLAAELNAQGLRAHALITDLTATENCKVAVDDTLGRFGRLDALVNNAGVNDGVGLEHGSPEAFVGSLKKNLLHYYNMAHFALPALKQAEGAIVNIASKTA